MNCGTLLKVLADNLDLPLVLSGVYDGFGVERFHPFDNGVVALKPCSVPNTSNDLIRKLYDLYGAVFYNGEESFKVGDDTAVVVSWEHFQVGYEVTGYEVVNGSLVLTVKLTAKE